MPRLNKLPRDYKFALGDRIQAQLYCVLEGLIRARYAGDKLAVLEALNVELEVVRYQTRLCRDLDLLDVRRYEHVSKLINEIGENLGGYWTGGARGCRSAARFSSTPGSRTYNLGYRVAAVR